MRHSGGMKPLLLTMFLAALTACDSPSLRMHGANRQVVEVGGSLFAVHWRGDEVEIYRTSIELSPSMSLTFAKATRAVEIATGCRVENGSLGGDVALMTARLECPGA